MMGQSKMIHDPSQLAQSLRHPLRCIFLVESDQNVSKTIVQFLSTQEVYHIFVIKGYQEALEVTQHMKPDLFIINKRLLDGSGIALYAQLEQHKALKDIPTIIIDEEQLILPHKSAQKQKIAAIAPFKPDLLLQYVTNLLAS